MSYQIEDHFPAGMPQTILVGGLASRALAGHWTAGAPGRAGALGSARFLVNERQRNASYHEVWWWERHRQAFGVLRLVRPERAAHSMNPAPPTWAPTANVRRLLGSRVGDPNANAYAVSFAGMPADLVSAVKDPAFIAACARRTRELVAQETTLTDPARPYFTHGEGQPSTRYDWGTELTPLIYAALEEEKEDDMTWRQYARLTAPHRVATVAGAIPYAGPGREHGEHSPGFAFGAGEALLSTIVVTLPANAGQWYGCTRGGNDVGLFWLAKSAVAKVEELSAPDDCTEQVAAGVARGFEAAKTAAISAVSQITE